MDQNSHYLELLQTLENERQVHILIMLSFYMGYAMSHLPGVLFSEYFNGIWILCKFQAFSFLVAIIPWAQVSFNGWRSIILIRSIMGFSQGTILRILGNMSQNRLPAEGNVLNQFVMRNNHVIILLINIQGSLLKFFFKWIYFYYSMVFCALLWILCLLIACHYNETSSPSSNHQENNTPPANPSRQTIVPHSSSTHSMLSPIRSEDIENFLRPSWWNLTLNTMQYHWTKTLLIAELNHLILDLRGPHIFSIISITLKIMIPFLLCWLLSLVVQQLFQSLTNQGTLHPRQSAKLKLVLATYFPLIFSDFASCLMSCNDGNSWEMIFNCAISVMTNMHSNINLNSLKMQLNTSPSLSSFGTLVHELGSITNIITVYFENLLGEEVNFEMIT
uniref:Uncharacterized protein n=1 Tax=Musca domestica TaxID=7370 RepID=A0A1I8N1G4_MUSDO